MRKNISTPEAPAAIGPYSQAVESGDFLFISGQIPLYPETSEVVAGDIENQARQVFSNMDAILRAAGYSLSNIVKTTVFLIDLKDFQKMNAVYGEFLSHKPARSTVEVSALPRNVRIEIEAIAIK